MTALVPIPGDIVRHRHREPGPKTRYYVVTSEYLGGVTIEAIRQHGKQDRGPASIEDVVVVRPNWALRIFRILIVAAIAVDRQRREKALAADFERRAQLRRMHDAEADADEIDEAA